MERGSDCALICGLLVSAMRSGPDGRAPLRAMFLSRFSRRRPDRGSIMHPSKQSVSRVESGIIHLTNYRGGGRVPGCGGREYCRARGFRLSVFSLWSSAFQACSTTASNGLSGPQVQMSPAVSGMLVGAGGLAVLLFFVYHIGNAIERYIQRKPQSPPKPEGQRPTLYHRINNGLSAILITWPGYLWGSGEPLKLMSFITLLPLYIVCLALLVFVPLFLVLHFIVGWIF